MALGMSWHKRTWLSVSRYLCVSEYQRARLEAVPELNGRLRVKPNSVIDSGPPVEPGSDIAYVGRLSEDKGVAMLLQAWQAVDGLGDRRLILVGDGPLRGMADAHAQADSRISVLGQQDRTSVRSLIDESALTVVPSLVPETFGRAVLESFAAGRAVVACNSGGLPELVDAEVGWLADPTVDSLANALGKALASDEMAQRGAAARKRYASRYKPSQVVQQLLGHYRDVMASQ
jgi:glycosyltransferase involved in cell wall biosynthesis